MKPALQELNGSVGSPDQVIKTQQGLRLEKAAPHLASPHEFSLDLRTVASAHMHTPMKLEERFENESVLDSDFGLPPMPGTVLP